MRTSFLLLSLSTVVVLASPLAAAQTMNTQAQPDDLSQVRVMGTQRHYVLRQDEVRELRGTYALSNGWYLKVRPTSRKLYAEIEGRQPIELVPLSADRFVSADGNTSMNFNLGQYGDEMVMRYVPDALTAQQFVVTAKMASR